MTEWYYRNSYNFISGLYSFKLSLNHNVYTEHNVMVRWLNEFWLRLCSAGHINTIDRTHKQTFTQLSLANRLNEKFNLFKWWWLFLVLWLIQYAYQSHCLAGFVWLNGRFSWKLEQIMNCVSYYNSFYPKYIQWIYNNKFYYNFAVITINVAVLFIIFLNGFGGWRNAGAGVGCSQSLEKLLKASLPFMKGESQESKTI